MTDEEFFESAKRHGWKTGDPVSRGMLLELMLPALNVLFGTEYEPAKKTEAKK